MILAKGFLMAAFCRGHKNNLLKAPLLEQKPRRKNQFDRKLVFALGMIIFTLDCSPPSHAIILEGSTMGTFWKVKVIEKNNLKKNKINKNQLTKKIESLLEEMVKTFSTYEKNSLISQINNLPANRWLRISEPMYTVLSMAHTLYEISGGAYDVTVGPLVNLWGFGPQKKQAESVSKFTIHETMKNVGMDKLIWTKIKSDYKLNRKPNNKSILKLKKKYSEVYTDLSSIAKGYTVDSIFSLLKKQGYDNFYVEIGGDIRVSGNAKDHRGWRIGIEKPIQNMSPGMSLQRILRTASLDLPSPGIATSGDYRNFRQVDGKKISHTISPLTGYPVETNIASVTVIAPNCMQADGFATLLMAVGDREKIKNLALPKRVHYYIILKEGLGFTEEFSPSLQKIFQ